MKDRNNNEIYNYWKYFWFGYAIFMWHDFNCISYWAPLKCGSEKSGDVKRKEKPLLHRNEMSRQRLWMQKETIRDTGLSQFILSVCQKVLNLSSKTEINYCLFFFCKHTSSPPLHEVIWCQRYNTINSECKQDNI